MFVVIYRNRRCVETKVEAGRWEASVACQCRYNDDMPVGMLGLKGTARPSWSAGNPTFCRQDLLSPPAQVAFGSSLGSSAYRDCVIMHRPRSSPPMACKDYSTSVQAQSGLMGTEAEESVGCNWRKRNRGGGMDALESHVEPRHPTQHGWTRLRAWSAAMDPATLSTACAQSSLASDSMLLLRTTPHRNTFACFSTREALRIWHHALRMACF